MTPKARRICLTSWVFAALACGYGLGADVEGTWARWPFATNVFTSFTAALAGVPIGVVFIRWITETQTSWRDPALIRKEVKVAQQRMELARENARILFGNLRSAVEQFLRPSIELSVYQEALDTTLEAHNSRYGMIEDHEKLPQLYRDLQDKLEQTAPSDLALAKRSFESICSHWSTYSNIKSSVADVGTLNILDPKQEGFIEQMLTGPGVIDPGFGWVAGLKSLKPEDRLTFDFMQVDSYLCTCISLYPLLEFKE
jgi:hypothetical protein